MVSRVLTVALAVVFLHIAALHAAPPEKEALADRVAKAIEKGQKFLTDYEGAHGGLEVATGRPGGSTALALLALLQSGVAPDEPIIERGLIALRGYQPQCTYTVGLQTMVFALAGKNVDRQLIQRNVDWLIQARAMKGKSLLGWGYTSANQGDHHYDYSNTQYALLGLHEGHQAGARVDEDVWLSIRDMYIDAQNADGGWGYPVKGAGSTPTMTVAGLCGLIIAGMDLNASREKILPNGRAENCGQYDDKTNRAVAKAFDFVSSHFPMLEGFDRMRYLHYWLYGIERAGRLTGLRFFGKNDWYRLGCQYLVDHQKSKGNWESRDLDGHPVFATSFALLFLSKGRTPILISKLAHNSTDPQNVSDDWNNDRNDARNLVEFASKELFKKTPLTWQVFDARSIRGETKRDRDLLLADLQQTPIVYFNGHGGPLFTGMEAGGNEPLLRQYLEEGGFIFAEACCGDERFDKGFRNLMQRMFPDTTLKLLGAEHPVWRASGKFVVRPDLFPLYGLDMGCKTVLIYSPTDLSCFWESNDRENGKAREAFRLGANIIAYATGMEPPKPRQFEIEVPNEPDKNNVPRGYLKVAQIRHGGDWQPAPRAMRNLMVSLQKLGLDTDPLTEPINANRENLADYRFLYMHGRNTFKMTAPEIKNLQFNLNTGGLLFADACCGSKTFDQAFRALMKDLWPDKKLEPIPLNDDLYSRELNNVAITKVRCRREGADGRPETDFREVDPFLEGIKIDGRWAVIYSKYDIGCALERHQSTECLGHDPDGAQKLATAAVLYALRR